MLNRRRLLAAAAASGGVAMMPRFVLAAAHGGDMYPTATGQIVVHPVSHASFVLEVPGMVIYNDPVGEAALYEGLPPADLILVSHEHGDHFNAETLAALAGDSTMLVTNPAVHGMRPDALKAKATALKNEFEREKARFEKARTRYLTQRVADQWRRLITTVSEKKVLEDGFTLQAARDFAENGMSDAIVARLEKQLSLEGEEIRQLWSQRANTPVGRRTEHFSYGDGSWVLGEKEILKGTAVAKAQEQQAGQQRAPAGNDREIEQFAKQLRQALERRRRAAQSGGEQRQLTDEGWWQQASRAEKVGWLRAYYAEYGGELVVKFATATKCISCYGEGTLPAIGGDGRPVREKCFLCQGTKWQRSFKAY